MLRSALLQAAKIQRQPFFLFFFFLWCLNMPWFEPFKAAREGLCSFTPAQRGVKEVACATLRGHSGTRAGHSQRARSSVAPDSTPSLLTPLFCPALALTLSPPLEGEKKNPHKHTKSASAAVERCLLGRWQLLQQVKRSSRCCGKALI